ncbi:hypothetical protein GGS24DRAFT_483011 [Hypoxylon argillaceum]|nr:hypothetical protein GGS24DRAFT_483011 [Hypoxylon argillaceum]
MSPPDAVPDLIQPATSQEVPRSGPLRVLVYLRESSPQYGTFISPYGGAWEARAQWNWNGVLSAAAQTLAETSAFASRTLSYAVLLAVQKLPRMLALVFDVNHDAYDWGTAHEQPADIPMVLVDYTKDSAIVRTALAADFRRRIHKQVAQQHLFHGWTVPPYFEDQSLTRARAPSYSAPRSLMPRPLDFEPQIERVYLS